MLASSTIGSPLPASKMREVNPPTVIRRTRTRRRNGGFDQVPHGAGSVSSTLRRAVMPIDSSRIAPEIFQIVILPHIIAEDMEHDIDKVDQHPRLSFDPAGTHGCELLLLAKLRCLISDCAPLSHWCRWRERNSRRPERVREHPEEPHQCAVCLPRGAGIDRELSRGLARSSLSMEPSVCGVR